MWGHQGLLGFSSPVGKGSWWMWLFLSTNRFFEKLRQNIWNFLSELRKECCPVMFQLTHKFSTDSVLLCACNNKALLVWWKSEYYDKHWICSKFISFGSTVFDQYLTTFFLFLVAKPHFHENHFQCSQNIKGNKSVLYVPACFRSQRERHSQMDVWDWCCLPPWLWQRRQQALYVLLYT